MLALSKNQFGISFCIMNILFYKYTSNCPLTVYSQNGKVEKMFKRSLQCALPTLPSVNTNHDTVVNIQHCRPYTPVATPGASQATGAPAGSSCPVGKVNMALSVKAVSTYAEGS